MELPYRASTFSRDHIETIPNLQANLIQVNQKKVLEDTMSWLIEDMQDRINRALTFRVMKSFVINIGGGIAVSGDVINELINSMATQDIHPNGFQQITLSHFGDKVEELNETGLDKVVESS